MAEQTYSITELAQEFDVTTRTIRFYEDQQLLEPLRAGQRRIYSRRDRVRLMLILRGKRIGLSLQEIRELFALYDAASDDAPQLHEFIRILQRKEQQLLEQMEDIKVVLSEISQLRHQCEKTLDRRGADARQST
ncbi:MULTISPECIES: MerR family transcriptional regulator [Chromobacterium]|uniref:MerR family DNA-binding transcriptional regulator n=3 Tax=Chromobacterium TaxID=535 RepID=A0ABS3GH38_9NEIS|nr:MULTISPECIES: MerR family DNA-binding transcriptional regulator [Chromobacterium]AXT46433.1 MerR family DNA-binding transcriptional regulator [Chromobacterium rhizoryzae]MBK0413257.1 MerR family DNA-binding transcriptional regulator [Chromobacterium haemolyticum]MBN3004221.1 MerR family DNA-binding transcriptional regulator [Chromobacterium alkanivorans]MBO0414359.1 MerR family DNA-binding transcriptional regulator [Chromobacterium haemolyticum]MBO0497782.1 MerR family DNA-binding transcrip